MGCMSKEKKIRPIVIVGAGGMGRDTQWLIERINESDRQEKYEILGYIDDGIEAGTMIDDYPVLGGIDDLVRQQKPVSAAFALGNAKVRKKLVEKCLQNPNLTYPNLIDPSVVMSKRIILGQGNIICTSVIMTTNIWMGDFNLICNRSIVGHDDRIGNYNTLYPGVLLSGNVRINTLTEIGTGSQIIQGLRITDEVTAGAGSTIIKDIDTPGTYVGSPVRRVNYEE